MPPDLDTINDRNLAWLAMGSAEMRRIPLKVWGLLGIGTLALCGLVQLVVR